MFDSIHGDLPFAYGKYYTTGLPLDAARQALADAAPEQTANWRS